MKRIKRFFGKMYLENPKKTSRMENLSIRSILIWFLIVALFIVFTDVNKGTVIALLMIVFVVLALVFFMLFYLAFNSSFWARKLPEYWIAEAEKIIGKEDKNLMERFYSLRIGILVKECKEEKPNSFDDLKKFVSEIRRYQSLKTRRKELQDAIRLLKEEESEIVSEARTLFQKQG